MKCLSTSLCPYVLIPVYWTNVVSRHAILRGKTCDSRVHNFIKLLLTRNVINMTATLPYPQIKRDYSKFMSVFSLWFKYLFTKDVVYSRMVSFFICVIITIVYVNLQFRLLFLPSLRQFTSFLSTISVITFFTNSLFTFVIWNSCYNFLFKCT